jgi:hypothetical protein
MMTVVPGGAPALATIDKRADAIKMWIDKAEAESASADQRGGGFVQDQTAARAHEPSQTGRRKSKPALERARGASKSYTRTAFPGKRWNRTRIYVDELVRSSSNLGYGTFRTTLF